MKLAQEQVPVLIILEGGSGHVISRVVNEISRSLEPRSVTYSHFDVGDSEPGSFSKFLFATPGKGEVVFFDRSWYSAYFKCYNKVKSEMLADMKVINAFEEYLMNNGTYIIKIALTVTPAIMDTHADEYRPFIPLLGTFLSVDRVKYCVTGADLFKGTDTSRIPRNIIEVGRPSRRSQRS